MADKDAVSPRQQARRYAALALYQWQLTGEDPLSIRRQLLDDPEWLDALVSSLAGGADDDPVDIKRRFRFDQALFEELLRGVPAHLTEIDGALDAFLSRPISQVDPVELAILRLGAYEILFAPNIPARVAINEAVELAKLLASEDSHRFVNGVLDKVARHKATPSATAADR